MPTIAELDVKLTADTGSAVSKLQAADRAIDQTGSTAQKAGGRVGGLSEGIKAGLVGGLVMSLNPIGLVTTGIGKMTAFLGDASAAAAAETAQITLLTNTIKQNVAGWDGNTEAIDAAVAAGERKAFSDDQTRASLDKLIQRTKNIEQATKLHAAAMDLSRARGISLEAASELLGKAIDGNVGPLNKMGLGLTKGADLTTILAGVQAQAGGAAEAYAGTQQAAGERAANAWGNFQEDVGGVINQVAGAVLPVLMDAMTNVLAVVTEVVQNLTPIFQEIVAVVGPVIQQVVSEISKFWTEIQPGVETAMGVIMGIMQVAWPVIQGIIEVAWAVISTVVRIAWEVVSGIIKTGMAIFSGDWQGAWDAIKGIFEGVWNAIKGFLESAWGIIKNTLEVGLGAARVIWEQAWNSIKSFFTGVWNFITVTIPEKLGEIAGSIVSWIGTTANNIGTEVGRWPAKFFTFITSIMALIGTKLGEIWTAITTWIGTTASNIVTEAIRIGGGILQGIMDGLAGAGQAIMNFIMEIARNVWEEIVGFFTGGATEEASQGGGGADSAPEFKGDFGQGGGFGMGGGMGGNSGGGGITVNIGTVYLYGSGDRAQQGRDFARGIGEELGLLARNASFRGRTR